MDLQVRGHGQHSGVEGDVVAGAGGQAVPRVQALAGRAVLPQLDVSGQQHPAGYARGWVRPQKTYRRPQLVNTFNANTCYPTRAAARMIRSISLLWPVTLDGATGNLIPQGALEYRRAQLILAEEGKLAAVLEAEEIGQAVAVDAFGAQQQTVDISEPSAVLRSLAPARMSYLPPCEREPSR